MLGKGATCVRKLPQSKSLACHTHSCSSMHSALAYAPLIVHSLLGIAVRANHTPWFTGIQMLSAERAVLATQVMRDTGVCCTAQHINRA